MDKKKTDKDGAVHYGAFDNTSREGSLNHSLQSGGGGNNGDMEKRLDRLENRFDKISDKLDTLIKDVAEIKGKISQIPTIWQLIVILIALMTFVLGAVKFGVAH